jgi:hypothetical protein
MDRAGVAPDDHRGCGQQACQLQEIGRRCEGDASPSFRDNVAGAAFFSGAPRDDHSASVTREIGRDPSEDLWCEHLAWMASAREEHGPRPVDVAPRIRQGRGTLGQPPSIGREWLHLW